MFKIWCKQVTLRVANTGLSILHEKVLQLAPSPSHFEGGFVFNSFISWVASSSLLAYYVLVLEVCSFRNLLLLRWFQRYNRGGHEENGWLSNYYYTFYSSTVSILFSLSFNFQLWNSHFYRKLSMPCPRGFRNPCQSIVGRGTHFFKSPVLVAL